MNKVKMVNFIGLVLSVVLLSNCAKSRNAIEPRVEFVAPSSTTIPISVTTTTVPFCSPNPSVNVSTGQIVRGVPVVIRFIGLGMCDRQFKVVGFPGVSSSLLLDITQVFNVAGSQELRFSIQLVDNSGNPVGASFSTLSILINVSEPSVTTTTTTTLNPVQLPSCTIERIPGSLATSNSQKSIWVDFKVRGQNLRSTLNGWPLDANPAGIYRVETHTFPFFEIEGRVTNSAGTGTCRLSVTTAYCFQSVVGKPTTTSVTTELTALGNYNEIYIQEVRQINPASNLPWVTYTENFTSSTAVRTRSITGRVRSLSGDSWSCPVTYTVPAAPPSRPPSFMKLGKELRAGDSLVPAGANSCSCRAVMQGDGNFVVYRGNKALWNSGTWGNPGAYFVLQTDGNMVVYRDYYDLDVYLGSIPRWSSYTVNEEAWRLYMQGDCNLVLYSDNFELAIWNSNTAQAGCY